MGAVLRISCSIFDSFLFSISHSRFRNQLTPHSEFRNRYQGFIRRKALRFSALHAATSTAAPIPTFWRKQLAIRLSCQKPQLSRWLPRKRRKEQKLPSLRSVRGLLLPLRAARGKVGMGAGEVQCSSSNMSTAAAISIIISPPFRCGYSPTLPAPGQSAPAAVYAAPRPVPPPAWSYHTPCCWLRPGQS